MAVLLGVLGCRLLRRTVSGTPRNPHPAVARWYGHLHGLATAIHEISGLGTFVQARGFVLYILLYFINHT
jgi:hypothetical protein